MTAYERQRLLIDRALDHLADPTVPVSRILDDCIRLAELRRDYTNLWWLRIESIGLDDKREMESLDVEMASAFATPAWKQLRQKVLLDYMARRRITGEKDEPLVSAESLQEMETALAGLEDPSSRRGPRRGCIPRICISRSRATRRSGPRLNTGSMAAA